MSPALQLLLVRAAAGALSVLAILLVIYYVNKMAKKHAEKLNIELTVAMKKAKAGEKKRKEKAKKKKTKKIKTSEK